MTGFSDCRSGSCQSVAGKRNTVHESHLTLVVIVGHMPGTAVVPEGHRAGLPVKAAGVLWLADMGIELI